ncbi:MAG: hypothetical protein OEY29_14510, partial [Gammaproteobacteria bacterium]|nr:hypothetical protein [Gammaproteobacteria bacterium]
RNEKRKQKSLKSMSINDITKDRLINKPNNDAYRRGYELIYGDNDASKKQSSTEVHGNVQPPEKSEKG